MDPLKNPFSPGVGTPPPELVGRDPVLDEARILFGRVKAKRAEKSLLLTGLRGVGKTVLLIEIERLAKQMGYTTIFIEAQENKSIGQLLVPFIRKALLDLDRMAGISEKVKRGLAVLRSFISTIKITVDDVTYGLDIEPEKGSADSGDLAVDLPSLFVAVGEAAENRNSALAICIDEIQYFGDLEFGALIMAMHKLQQQQLPVVLVGAGLPILPRLAGETKSYAERLFSFPEIGALASADATRALQEPAQSEGAAFELDALDEIYRLTKGYPYFVQEWGYTSWNLAPSNSITKAVVQDATQTVVSKLDKGFFRVRYERTTNSEKRFLRAMATLGPGKQRTGDIADKLKVNVQSIGPVRATLIQKGLIYSPSYGELEFTVPLFDEFMMRAIPDFKP